jgi:hypothetical protein
MPIQPIAYAPADFFVRPSENTGESTAMKDKLNRNLFALVISTLALSCSIVVLLNLFFFSKSTLVPTWVNRLPEPFHFGSFPGIAACIVFICLCPAAFIPETPRKAISVLIKTILLSPLPGLFIYTNKLMHQITDYRDLLNIPFQYLWVIIFNCIVPAFVLIILRNITNYYKRPNKSNTADRLRSG